MDRLGDMMTMLVMWLVVTTNLSGVVTQSVRPGGCQVEDGIFSCSKIGTTDIITSIQQTDVNTIDVLCKVINTEWLDFDNKTTETPPI